MRKSDTIFVAGAGGCAGNTVVRYLKERGYSSVIDDQSVSLNVQSQSTVEKFFQDHRPAAVVFTYIKSGGIIANFNNPAEFFYENIQAQINVIGSAKRWGVKKLIFCGSSCMYPIKAKQPIEETAILTGLLELTSQAYAMAKLSGWQMCAAYRKQYNLDYVCLVPATVYGPNDDFTDQSGHVIASLISRFHQAVIRKKKNVAVWGSGNPRREFIYAQDFAAAVELLLRKKCSTDLINCGTGIDIRIKELAELIKKITGFTGQIIFDYSKPDGVNRKLLDSKKIRALGWKPKTSLVQGVTQAWQWCCGKVV